MNALMNLDWNAVVQLEYKLSECDDLDELRAKIQADIAQTVAAEVPVLTVFLHAQCCIANLQQNGALQSAGALLPFADFTCVITVRNNVQWP